MKARVAASAVPPALVAPTMRRLTRPRGRLMRTLTFDARVRPDNLLVRVNGARSCRRPPKRGRPVSSPSMTWLRADFRAGFRGGSCGLLERRAWFASVPLIVALVARVAPVVCVAAGALVAGVVVVLGLALTAALACSPAPRSATPTRCAKAAQTPESVDPLPSSPTSPSPIPCPRPPPRHCPATAVTARKARASRRALKDLHAVVQASAAADTVGENGPERAPLDLARDSEIAVGRSIRRSRFRAAPRRSSRCRRASARSCRTAFVEAMAYPVFDIPMYKPLAELSAELLIPNVNLIENNSITLLETNQRFIEAYMVGLNHEFARELLWREYPTDQRGSYFRQFWDVSGFFAGPRADDDAAARDAARHPAAPRVAARLRSSATMMRASAPGENEEELVLVIRGELLKRYPEAVIYAQSGRMGDDEWRDRSLEGADAGRRSQPAEEANPPRAKLRTPLYMAKVEPDLYFLGFDLTVPEARGGDGTSDTDPPGWFFVIKERPGEPRFGFDETVRAQIVVWNDLAWDRVPMAGQRTVRFLARPRRPDPRSVTAGRGGEGGAARGRRARRWGDDVSAAELAYIMYQAPVMVAIHAAEMLPRT